MLLSGHTHVYADTMVGDTLRSFVVTSFPIEGSSIIVDVLSDHESTITRNTL